MRVIGKEMRATVEVNRLLDVKRPEETNLVIAAKQADERIRAEQAKRAADDKERAFQESLLVEERWKDAQAAV